jgi:hypothetical protein
VTVPTEAEHVSVIYPPSVPEVIENTELLISTGLPSASLTRTKVFVEEVLGIVHDCEPSSGVLAITLVQNVPLLVEYSI